MTDLVEVLVGVVGRAHGIRGDVFIDLRTDEPGRRFQPGSGLRLASGAQLVLERIRWHRGRLVVSFRGYPDRTAVETLRGERLFVDVPADETPSEPEEYFDRQLIGEVPPENSEAAGISAAFTVTYCVIRRGCYRLPPSLKPTALI